MQWETATPVGFAVCMQYSIFILFFWFRPWQAGKALLPEGTRETSRNQESAQSSAMCSSSTLGCLRAWQSRLHFMVSDLAYPNDVSCPLPH